MSVLPRSNLHLDILMGRDEAIEPVDVFGGKCILCSIHQMLTDS